MTTPYIIEMIEKYLKDNGFMGLCNNSCGCYLPDLSPGDCLKGDCQAVCDPTIEPVELTE